MATDYQKDPSAVLDYHWDWTDWLASGEAIASSVITPSAGIVLDSSGFSPTSATAWISGGVVGSTYSVANLITTSQGRTDERTITIRVQNR